MPDVLTFPALGWQATRAQSDELKVQAEQTGKELSAILDEFARPADDFQCGEVLGAARRSTVARFVFNLRADASKNTVPLAPDCRQHRLAVGQGRRRHSAALIAFGTPQRNWSMRRVPRQRRSENRYDGRFRG